MPTQQLEKTLQQLQGLIRQRAPADVEYTSTFRVPADLAGSERRYYSLTRGQQLLFEEVKSQLVSDPRFEYLTDREAQSALRRFVVLCGQDRSVSQVPSFVASYGRQVISATCYIPVRYLRVTTTYQLKDVRLLPLADSDVPIWREPVGPEQDEWSSVIAVPVAGTNYRTMEERARRRASTALAIVRTEMRRSNSFSPAQLRFSLDENFAFSTEATGWSRRPDAPIHAAICAARVEAWNSSRLTRLVEEPSNGLERQAQLAIVWINHAMLATDELVAMLDLFFALEALLGDTSEGIKSLNLAFRRTILGHLVSDEFPDPERLYYYYEDVRSAAVHGSIPPSVTWREVRSFMFDTIQVLNEYLEYAERNDLTRRSRLVRALRTHAEVPAVLEWLRGRHERWQEYEPAPS